MIDSPLHLHHVLKPSLQGEQEVYILSFCNEKLLFQLGGRLRSYYSKRIMFKGFTHSLHNILRRLCVTNSLIHLFFHSYNQLFIHLFVHSFIHSFVCSFMHSFDHSFFHSLIYLLICSFIRSPPSTH